MFEVSKHNGIGIIFIHPRELEASGKNYLKVLTKKEEIIDMAQIGSVLIIFGLHRMEWENLINNSDT